MRPLEDELQQRRPKPRQVDNADLERDRQALMVQARARGNASKRAATAKTSSEEMRQRQRQREAAAAVQRPVLPRRLGAATARLTFDAQCPRRIATLPPDQARIVMQTRPKRLPNLVLQSPHEAVPSFHEDWTLVEGSRDDPAKREQEMRLRDVRNRMIHEFLVDGRIAFYSSSGNSMWPLIHAHDSILLHPIMAVTAMDGRHTINKEASKIDVGDVVFCLVQRWQQYYAHFVLDIEDDRHAHENKYWIGNLAGHCNGWCYREHIFGIVVTVQCMWDKKYYPRPHPKDNFHAVKHMMEEKRWKDAEGLCEPDWTKPLAPPQENTDENMDPSMAEFSRGQPGTARDSPEPQ